MQQRGKYLPCSRIIIIIIMIACLLLLFYSA
jgi:hypothetical protein